MTKTIKATGQQWRYTYDVYDRLLQAATYASAGATSPDRIITYAYDALDRRIQRSDATASASSATAVETYIHDGWNTNAIEERTINFGSTIARRTWYTQAGTDDLVALTTWDQASGGPAAAGSAYYSADHLGSVRALHDDTGTVVASYDHDTFGNPQTAVESVPQPFRFTGRDYDSVTGLYHYRTREYDPQAGRFLQEDSIWFNSGDMNVYRYVGGNPVKYRDPSGRLAAQEEVLIDSKVIGTSVVGVVAAEALLDAAGAAAIRKASQSALQLVGAGIACELFILANAIPHGGTPEQENCTTTGIDTPNPVPNPAPAPAPPRSPPGPTKPPAPPTPTPPKKDKCDIQFDADWLACQTFPRTKKLTAACYAQAYVRYGHCIANRPGPLPPLTY